MKNKIIGTLLLMLVVSCALGRTYFVHSQQEFNRINLTAGDDVTIANGQYSGWSLKLAAFGTERKRISIHAETTGKVIFSGDITQTLFQLTGDYITISGFVFQDCNLIKILGKVNFLIELKSSSYCRISNCQFIRDTVGAQYRPIVVISGNGRYNDIDNCSFISNMNNQEIQIRITKDNCPLYTQISNNLFKDKSKVTWPVYNGGECIQVGQDQVNLGNTEAKTTVRNNKFINCFGDAELISNKSSSNKYIGNYFENCGGELVIRGGAGCLVDSNVFFGGRSAIRISGTQHIITNNRISNTQTGIRLMYGMAKGRFALGLYIAATDCVVKNNQFVNTKIGIIVGDGKNSEWKGKFDANKYRSRTIQDVAPADNKVDNNVFSGTETKIQVKQ